MGWLGDILGVAAPVIGTAIGGPLGGALGAAAGGAIAGAGKQGKANQLRDHALEADQQDYTARAPVRNLALQRALQGIPQRPDLGQLFSNTGNPYERQALARPPVAMPPNVAPPAAMPNANQTTFNGLPDKTQQVFRRLNPNMDQLLNQAPQGNLGAGGAPGSKASEFFRRLNPGFGAPPARPSVAMPPTGPTY